jgi:prevent-host-death family protein
VTAPAPRTVALRRLRATLRAVVCAVEAGGEPVVVTRHGRPVAALVPVRALEAPSAGGCGDETPRRSPENGLEVSVPSPLGGADMTTRPSRLSRPSSPQGGRP